MKESDHTLTSADVDVFLVFRYPQRHVIITLFRTTILKSQSFWVISSIVVLNVVNKVLLCKCKKRLAPPSLKYKFA